MKSIYNKAVIFSIIAVLFFMLDRLLKGFFLNNSTQSFDLIDGFLSLHFVKNYYVAFSLPIKGLGLEILIIIISIALSYILVRLVKNYKFYQALLIFLTLLGAVSNLIDRVQFGFVIDYIDFIYYPVFNIADSMIVCGMLLFAIKTFKLYREG